MAKKRKKPTKGVFDVGIDDKSTPVIGVEKITYYRNGDTIKKKTFRAKGPKGYGLKKMKKSKTKYYRSGEVASRDVGKITFRESLPLAETPRPFLE